MTQGRFEIYRPIHKAVRYLLFSTATTLGEMDLNDDEVTREALEKLERTITLLREHALHEADFVHTALEGRSPGITAPFAGDHQKDEQAYAQLRRLSGQIRSADVDQSVALGNEVYGLFNRFIGEYLMHLDREEQVLEKALWDHFTDEELAAIDHAIEMSVSPELMETFLTAFCRSFNPGELVKILGGMKAAAPPEVTEWAFGLAKQATPQATWEKVWPKLS